MLVILTVNVSDLLINDAIQSDQIYTICVNNYRAVGGGIMICTLTNL